jgi:hypothetical protein
METNLDAPAHPLHGVHHPPSTVQGDLSGREESIANPARPWVGGMLLLRPLTATVAVLAGVRAPTVMATLTYNGSTQFLTAYSQRGWRGHLAPVG